jgi:hypothetical protein
MKIFVGLLFLFPVVTFGQQYVAEAPLPSVNAEGFYSIPLPSDVTSRMTVDCGNVRILDEKGVEVPYILVKERPQFSKTEFIEYKMQKEQRKDCCTLLTLINDKRNTISNIMLEVKNADVTKRATLVGSDDQRTWYALKENDLVGGFSNPNSTSEIEIVSFPLSNYQYYKLILDDSTSTPFNIIRAGYYNTSTVNGAYTEIPGVSIASADSVKDKTTWATITMPADVEFVDKIQFDIEGPKFYYRSAALYTKDEYMNKGVKKEYLNEVLTFDITSTHENSLNISMKPTALRLKIQNESNPPLKLKGVRAWQLRRSLTTYLTAGHTYKLVIAEPAMVAPTYDLVMFQDSIPKVLPTITPGAVTNFERKKELVESTTYFTNRNIIWVAIVVVIAILGFMSVRMIRESDKDRERK